MAAATITYFGDPLSVVGYRHAPTLARLRYTYPDLDWQYRCIVTFPTAFDGDRATAIARELAAIQRTNDLPATPSAYEDHVPASWLACQAIVTARSIADTETVFAFARELSHRAFATGVPPTSTDVIADAAATIPDLDATALTDNIDTRTATTAVGRDLEITRRTVETLPDADVYGTPDIQPLEPRSHPDTPSRTDTTTPDPTTTSIDAGVFATPVYRVTDDAETSVLTVDTDSDTIDAAINRHAPDAGVDRTESTTQGRDAMETYGANPRTAEQLSAEDFPSRIIDILEFLGPAHTPEIAACLDTTTRTCDVELHDLAGTGRVTRTSTGAWALTPEE